MSTLEQNETQTPAFIQTPTAAEPTRITIAYRRIICKQCALEGDTDAGFRFAESKEFPERVAATCEKCGTVNLIKRVRLA